MSFKLTTYGLKKLRKKLKLKYLQQHQVKKRAQKQNKKVKNK
jgi:hypothetical protein